MERAHHVADDFCTFLEGGAGVETQDAHAIKNAPVNRLQAVAGIRQCPTHDRRKRIGEIALFERLAQIDGYRLAHRGRSDAFGHEIAFSVYPLAFKGGNDFLEDELSRRNLLCGSA